MAVKAREEVRSREFSAIGMILIGLFVVAYVFIYNRSISQMDDYALKTGIGIAALIVMIVVFVVILRFITTGFFMLLTHQSLNIERKIFFWRKEIADIPVKAMFDVVPEEAFKGINGKVKNYTVVRIENKAKYVVLYREGGQVCGAKIQCSSKFHKALKSVVSQNKNAKKV